MKLLTPISIAKNTRSITYEDKILTIGSCFAENISDKLSQVYFRIETNPFGILYNPISIANCLNELLGTNTTLSDSLVVQHNGMYHSLLHHGSFSRANIIGFKEVTDLSIEQGRQWLNEADVIIITFGTAWVYEKDGEVVANCHKMPSNDFVRRRLSVDEIVNTWLYILDLPTLTDKHFIFTVSPIRHIKDGMHENQLSKSTLLLAIDQLIEQRTLLKPSISYFPSYEIMLDELRDYRFYADDMLHPSTKAVDYIYERFEQTYFDTNTIEEAKKLHSLYQQLHHRPLHPDAPQYQNFVQQTQQLLNSLKDKYPWIRDDKH